MLEEGVPVFVVGVAGITLENAQVNRQMDPGAKVVGSGDEGFRGADILEGRETGRGLRQPEPSAGRTKGLTQDSRKVSRSRTSTRGKQGERVSGYRVNGYNSVTGIF